MLTIKALKHGDMQILVLGLVEREGGCGSVAGLDLGQSHLDIDGSIVQPFFRVKGHIDKDESGMPIYRFGASDATRSTNRRWATRIGDKILHQCWIRGRCRN